MKVTKSDLQKAVNALEQRLEKLHEKEASQAQTIIELKKENSKMKAQFRTLVDQYGKMVVDALLREAGLSAEKEK